MKDVELILEYKLLPPIKLLGKCTNKERLGKTTSLKKINCKRKNKQQVMFDDQTEPQLVTKLLLQVSVRELHNSLVIGGPPQ